MSKKTILILTDHYLPCRTSGGPVITVQNMIHNYHDQYDFYIVCLNRDLDSKNEYSFKTNVFIDRDNYHCMYVKDFSSSVFDLLISYCFDVYYCLGTYSKYTRFFLLKKNQKRIKKSILVIAPMGNFSSGALAIKSFKKKIFFTLFRRKFISKKITWSFTSELELDEARKVLGAGVSKSHYYICPDPVLFNDNFLKIDSTPKNGLFVFVSRICKKKGLLDGIKALKATNTPCSLDVYGSIEDENYWNCCLDEAKHSNVCLLYKGEVKHEEIIDVFSRYSFFLFFTKGENFGHVVFESLNGGCLPIVTKSVTPWDSLLDSIYLYKDIRDNLGKVFELSEIEKRKIAEQSIMTAKRYFETANKENFIKMIEE